MTEREIFTAALTKEDPAERAAFLDEACAGDAPLRQRVESLLAEQQQLGSFMDVATPAATLFPLPLERPGSVIGPYKLLQQIGEGGMGTVFMAEQTQPVQRKVAIKVIKPGMDSRQVIARFEAERQALAMMDHVNIARVLDAGATESGRPYFVMELVHGVPITKYCDDHHLTPRERLELFVPVCQAIQHAHQKGIIHRDIKPSNVMVTLYDGKPVPKVIDFGVAKATEQKLTERTLFTQYGMMVGTLEYMSPEQAEMSALGVDTRSDIYSLGVLLYELLTGSTPLTHKRMKEVAYAEILRMIKDEEPPKPSTRLSDSGEALASISANRHTEPAKLTKLVRGELDWIVMKTLEKDRNRRYETAKDFAADVQRYLDDEQVQACPPSAMYRFRKFARRNKARLLTGGTLAVAALVIAGVVAAGLGRAARDRQFRQDKLNHEVEMAIKDANHSRERALTLTDNPYQWEATLAAAGSAVKSAAGIAAQDHAALLPELQDQLRSLQKALEADERDRHFAARLDAIRLDQSELNMTYYNFKLDNAYPAIRQTLDDFYEIKIGTMPKGEAERIVQGRPKSIQQFLLAALELAHTHVPPTEPDTKTWLADVLAAVDPAPWRQRALRAEQTGDWVSLAQLVAELTAARQPPSNLLRLAERAPVESPSRLTMLRRIRQAYPADFWANHQLAGSLHRRRDPQLDEAARYYAAALALRPLSAAAAINLGDSLREKGDNEGALDVYRDTLRLNPDYDYAHFSIGLALVALGRLDEAASEMHEAIRLRPELANGYWGWSEVLVKQKKFTDAEAALRDGLKREPRHYWCRFALANLMLMQKRSAEAETEFRELVRLDPKVAYGHIYLGRSLQAQQKFSEAEEAYFEAIRQHPGNADAHTMLAELRQQRGTAAAAEASLRTSKAPAADAYDTQLQLGMLLKQQQKFAEAEDCLREAARLRPEMALAHYELGLVLDSVKQPAQAAMAIRESIRLCPTWAAAHSSLGWVLLREKNPIGAEAAFREAIRLLSDNWGAHYGLGVALRDQKKIAAAQDAYREALRINPDDFYSQRELAWSYVEQKRWSEAEAEFREALRLSPEHASVHFGLGRSLFELQKLAEAEAAWREGLRLEPGREEVHINLSRLLRQQQRFAEAETALSEALRQNPGSARTHVERGSLLLQQKKAADAEPEFREAVRLMPGLAGAQFGLGNSLAKLARPAEAIGPLREAIRLALDDHNAHNILGWALFEQRQFAEAELAFREAVRLAPDEAGHQFGLGRVLFEQKHLEAAEAPLREAIRLNPAHPHARQFLVRVLIGQGKPEEAEALQKEHSPAASPPKPEIKEDGR